jgi:hypothetical protein
LGADLSNSGQPFDYRVKAGQPARTRTAKWRNKIMAQFLVAVQLPDNFDPSKQPESTERDIDALNHEMAAAGVVVFVGGLTPVREAKSLQAQPDGKVLTTDGPYLETKEHLGGFWVLEVADLNQALEWGRKAVIACRTPVEVREFGVPPA